MTTTPRPRFSLRAGLSTPVHDGPFDGVPAHLLGPLQSWVEKDLAILDARNTEQEGARRICVRLRIAAPSDDYAHRLFNSAGAELLDVVDSLLAYRAEARIVQPGRLQTLTDLLDEAGSAYRVNDGLDGLEERVTAAVRDAVRRTIADAAGVPAAGSAADHLATAWQAAYGRRPDPVRAYSESIKAVESAAHAVIQPRHGRATLGTMLGEIGNARAKFTVAVPTPAGKDPIAPVEAMMRTLWDGQTSRHGNQGGTVSESLDSARAGVHFAAALVQWFTSGAVARNP
ncbi:hypothetical protein OHU11_12695 [Streptomyces sp. NBC_00257]|uniref:hypothetical protein n=1 Tax=Streptomyces TaxID=1883 RepID=UPI002256CE46|nr:MULTISPECIES: hypothetical protein [unclassified Streptomyces]WTB57219.1 hypothetical protein OG832_30720 [Streptomyces sp. NBC_00826]WTH89899.1 hypothetical protein OIC43_12970 [Streptomyces sp. NBC_00825]WTH98626.1 hypothetical protein OHA23_12955 [Streptomyces sp. NBC_00822]MCX4864008.1 hypothetical protein [Streptomyces sp. NBC_00906]MCX4895246.1 hypothetical protein [Streptomyces sp. NBC_00892]